MKTTVPTLVSLDDLTDAALVRIIVLGGCLNPTVIADLLRGIRKLLIHFHSESRLQRAALTTIADDTALLIAWEGPTLSGCSHDKINALLAHHASAEQNFLDLPPIHLRCRDGWRCGTRSDLRVWLNEGVADGGSLYLDRNATDLGQWRRQGLVPLTQSPLSRLLPQA